MEKIFDEPFFHLVDQPNFCKIDYHDPSLNIITEESYEIPVLPYVCV